MKEEKGIEAVLCSINRFISNDATNVGIVSSASENENMVNLSRLNELVEQLLQFRDVIDEYFKFMFLEVISQEGDHLKVGLYPAIFDPYFKKWWELDDIHTSIEKGFFYQALYLASSETQLSRIQLDNAAGKLLCKYLIFNI